MSSSAPAVSVVMPVHDGERFLREAVESVLAQTLADVELVAVDDGSTDSTRDILEEYARADRRVVVTATDHVGQADARNAAVALARADMIAFLDADDVACADRLERQVAFLAGHEELAVVGGALTFIDEDGCAFAEDVRYPISDGEIRAAFAQMTPIANSAALVRRSAFLAVGGLRRAFADSEDLDLWLRIAERHRLGNLEQTVVRYRIHRAQASMQRLEQQSLTALAARLSARARSTGSPDPFDGVERVDRDLLLGLGATEHELVENIVMQGTWLARTIYRAGDVDRGEALFADVLARAQAAASPELAGHVELERSHARSGRRSAWRARIRSLLPGSPPARAR